MQIGSGMSAMSGAQVALRLLAPPAPVDAPARKAGADAPAGAGDVSALMTYAKQARRWQSRRLRHRRQILRCRSCPQATLSGPGVG